MARPSRLDSSSQFGSDVLHGNGGCPRPTYPCPTQPYMGRVRLGPLPWSHPQLFAASRHARNRFPPPSTAAFAKSARQGHPAQRHRRRGLAGLANRQALYDLQQWRHQPSPWSPWPASGSCGDGITLAEPRLYVAQVEARMGAPPTTGAALLRGGRVAMRTSAALLLALVAALATARSPAQQLVLFGATGDLASRFTLQASFELWALTGRGLEVTAVGRSSNTSAAVRNALAPEAACKGSVFKSAGSCESALDSFVRTSLSVRTVGTPSELQDLCTGLDAAAGGAEELRRVFHLGVPPSAVPELVRGLARACAPAGGGGDPLRSAVILVEKPLGRDGAAAQTQLEALGAW